jgi:hypothetical protein
MIVDITTPLSPVQPHLVILLVPNTPLLGFRTSNCSQHKLDIHPSGPSEEDKFIRFNFSHNWISFVSMS